MQNMSYIGDAINNKILRLKRPVTVPIDHLDQIYEWISYITEGYLCCETNVPNDCAIMNAVYRMECAPIRTEYAKTHKRPEGPISHFRSEISTLEDADKGSVTHSAVMENYARQEAKAREAGSGKVPARNTKLGRDRCDNNRQP